MSLQISQGSPFLAQLMNRRAIALRRVRLLVRVVPLFVRGFREKHSQSGDHSAGGGSSKGRYKRRARILLEAPNVLRAIGRVDGNDPRHRRRKEAQDVVPPR